MDAIDMGAVKYGPEQGFHDPVVRCDSCQKLLTMQKLRDLGRCPDCGGRKVRNVFSLSKDERATLERNQVDPDFLALFEQVDD